MSPDGEQPAEVKVGVLEPVRHSDNTGTGNITLTAAQGSAVLENTELADIDLDTKMELVRLNLLSEADLEGDRKGMMALWNRFRSARQRSGEEFDDTWASIDQMKQSGQAKRLPLFAWVRCRGFTKNMIEEVNAVSQAEKLKSGKHLLEFHELCQ